METVTREKINRIFKKVKKLRIPTNLESVNFDSLKYYSWEDSTDKTLYILCNYKGELRGVNCEIVNLVNKTLSGICSFCGKPMKNTDMALISAKPKRLPKDTNYQTFGLYVCIDYVKCNHLMQDTSKVEEYFARIHNNI